MSGEKPRIIIAGAPASGKGTQCELIVEKFGVVHISTGDALRAQVKAETELGMKAKEFMESGGLVPDELIIGIVKARLAEEDCQTQGWLLDGFPRTGVQAEAMIAAGIHATHFVLLEVPDEILVERCVGRRSDPDTGKIYHLKFHPPPEDDEALIARLVHRADDTEEAMGNRIKSYHENVKAVTPFYESLMQTFDGQTDKTEIASKVAEFLSAPVSSAPVSSAPVPPGGPLGIIIAGAPASGKGTQCELIVEKFGVVHISTGDALRAQVKAETELGMKAKEFMESGGLVPDDLIIGIVKARLAEDDCKTKGWLLDGFPRTGVQAEAMIGAGIHATHFVLLEVPDDILVERCVGRRSDPDTGKIYHLKFHPPPEDDAELMARLVHRADDTAEAMGNRIKSYHENVKAVTPFYERLMQTFDGQAEKTGIADKVAAFLGTTPSSSGGASGGASRGGTSGGERGGGAVPRILMAGAQGSGKLTQSKMLEEQFGCVHIKSAELLRACVEEQTPLGAQMREVMNHGLLTSDALIVEVIMARMNMADCREKGWVLDGFPKTSNQAELLVAAGANVTHMVVMDVPDAILVERCVARRTDPVTGIVYHLRFNPPPNDPEVIERLQQRTDDTEVSLSKRVKGYRESIAHVAGLFEGKMHVMDGTREVADINAELQMVINGQTPEKKAPGWKVIVVGSPASGKGTQCEKMSAKYGMVHVSTGDELRRHVAAGSQIGLAAKEFMAAGKLIPDEVIVGLVVARLGHKDCKDRGWLLDGFPRTAAQALALKAAGIEPDRCILLDVHDQVVVERCVGRRLDPVTEKIYHLVFNPPPQEIAARMVHRDDDTHAAITERLRAYTDNIGSVLQYYECVARRIHGMRPAEEVFSDVERFIDGEIPPDMSGRPSRKPLPTPEEAQAYIQKHLQPTIIKALAAVAQNKPDNPIQFLATTLMALNPNRPAVALAVPGDAPGVVSKGAATKDEKVPARGATQSEK